MTTILKCRDLLLLSALIITAGGLASPKANASRCTPLPPINHGWLVQSDLVFSGAALDATYPPQTLHYDAREARFLEVTSTGDRVVWRFRVDGVWKGEAGSSIEVRSERSAVSGGYEFEPGERYLVFASRNLDDTLRTGLCSRTARWDQALIERYVLGQPRWSSNEFEAPPTLEEFESMLLGEDPRLQQLALTFWSDSDCGQNFLAWQLDNLDLPPLQRRRLEEQSASVSTRPGAASSGAAPPRTAAWNYRVCTAAERSWVRARIGDWIFLPSPSGTDQTPPPNSPPQAGEG